MALVCKVLYTSLGVSAQTALGRAWHPCSFQVQEIFMWLWLYQATLSIVHNDCHVDLGPYNLKGKSANSYVVLFLCTL